MELDVELIITLEVKFVNCFNNVCVQILVETFHCWQHYTALIAEIFRAMIQYLL